MKRRNKNSSCPALCRVSTPFFSNARETWMAGTSPAMTGRAQAAIIRLRRRDFIALMGGAAAVWPLAARAQKVPVVGLLGGVSFVGAYAATVALIRQGLQEAGFVEGRNLVIEYRTADGHSERLPELAADLVRRQVGVIVAIGASAPALAAKAATSTIPIVFAMGADAVEVGLVKSLNRPEANVTGMSFATGPLAPKRLELLLEVAPDAKLVGYLDNSRLTRGFEIYVRELTTAARFKGRELAVFDAGTEQEVETAFAGMAQQRVGALVVSPDAFLLTRLEQIVALAARHALPTIYIARGAVALGGLMSYGALVDDMVRQAGIYAGRILKGATPAELPVVLPTRFELVINLKTAKALGLAVPPTLLALADEVIE
jgi:putative ABC transport system substrate-binding protein